MNSFSGVVALAGEPESAVAATVEVDAGMLTLTAGGSEIGAWSLEEIQVEQTAGAFNLRADGEDLVLTTPDMTAFADAVGAGVAVEEPKREKRRRFGFRAGRDKTTGPEPEAELEPPPPPIAVPPPPPPAEDLQPNQFADSATEAAIAVDPGFSTAPDTSAFLTEQDLPTDPEPAFSTNPDMPAFVDDEHPPSESFEEPADHRAPTPESIIEASPGFAGSSADDPSEPSPLIDAAATPSWADSADAEAALPPRAEKTESAISFAPTPPPPLEPLAETSFDPPQPASAAEPTPEPALDFAPPEPLSAPAPAEQVAEPTPEPAFGFAAPEPIFDETPAEPIAEPGDESPSAVEPATPEAMDEDFDSAPASTLPAIDSWSDESLVPPNGARTDDTISAVAGWSAPQPATGRWPEPDMSARTAVDPTPEAVASEPELPGLAPSTAESAPHRETDAEALGADESAPPADPAALPVDDVSDAAGRDVPAIAGIAAVATPDRYVTVESDDVAPESGDPDGGLAVRPEHGADMATQDEIAAWIADVNGDAVPDEDQPGGVVPSRFDALRTRSAENYSDENVLSTPLTMAMFFTAFALVLGTLLSWGIYALADSFPVERLVSAVAAFAVTGGAYLGWRQDRRIAGSILAIGGGMLALAAVYAYAREADIGIGFLLATAGAVAAVALGIVGVTRFGHGPDPRIRE